MPVLTVDSREISPQSADSTVASYLKRNALLVAAAAGGWFALFWPTLRGLCGYWLEDPDFSHGFIVPLISGAILYSNRGHLGSLGVRGTGKCLVLLLLSILVFVMGALSYTNLLERIAAWGSLVAGVGFLVGTEILKRKPFPFLFLLFAIPPPFYLASPLRLTLKGIATRVSADLLSLCGYPALAEGNVLTLGEHQLEVADACSGIRSLMAILATAVLLGYLFRAGLLKGALLTVTAIPVTVAVNVLRIVIIAVALARYDFDLTHGARHEAVGFAVFGVSLFLLYASWVFYSWFLRWKPGKEAT